MQFRGYTDNQTSQLAPKPGLHSHTVLLVYVLYLICKNTIDMKVIYISPN